MKKYCIALVALVALIAGGCIKNDIPYPRIQANFVSLDAKGQDKGTVIDTVACTATITFPEQVDITDVKITGWTLTPGAEIVGEPFAGTIDLSSPVSVILRLYQDYRWKIIGVQDIERYFDVVGQIGATTIDVPGRRIVLNVPETQNLKAITVEKAKLGAIGSTMTPDLSDGGVVDASKPVEIEVTSFGRTETWTLYVEPVDVTVRTVSVDAWTCVAWINGMGEAGKEFGAQYRLAGTDEWTDVAQTDITVTGGNFVARVAHLSPQTSYQARVTSGEFTGEIIDFTTGTAAQLPNSDFDNWWLDGKVWCPWAEDGTPFWGTGNKGATTLGDSNTTPTDDTPSGSGWAARLETRFVGIGALGNIAAGNIFAGSYVKTVGTNGVLSFGREFTDRPVKLRGQYKYTDTNISHSSADYKQLIGQPDTCIIWVALIDSDEPFEIRTAPSDRQLFDENGPEVVAYGKMECAQTIPSYIPFEFEINYKATNRRPKYILVTASASKYGDFFTGGNGSTLYIDDFELVYDY